MRKKGQVMKRKQITINHDLNERLEVFAAQRGLAQSDVIRRALEIYILAKKEKAVINHQTAL